MSDRPDTRTDETPKRPNLRAVPPIEQFALVPMALINNPQIHASAIRVYARLAGAVNSQDSVPAAWLSARSLASELGISRRTVERAIEALIQYGWLAPVDESNWLPRWKNALDGHVQTVRVFRLPRHPKKTPNQTPHKPTRKEKAAEETRTKRAKDRAFYEKGLREYLQTGEVPNRILGKNATLEMALHNGKIVDEASVQRWLDQHFKEG